VHSDKVLIEIRDRVHRLWLVEDQNTYASGDILQKRRNTRAARRLLALQKRESNLQTFRLLGRMALPIYLHQADVANHFAFFHLSHEA